MEFQKSFFKQEIRCGFEIPAMMKRAWAAQMEVLQVVAEICEKNGLQYFADGGTLLGAVRHQGFIPWDDDIDICLKRNEYMHLIRILPQELPYGFAVAGMYAESERLQNAAFVPHLRVIADEMKWNFNDYMIRFHGFPYQRVGIDIFPLDHVPEDSGAVHAQRTLMRQGIAILRDWDQLECFGKLEGYIHGFEEACKIKMQRDGKIKNQMWRIVDAISSLYENEETEIISNYADRMEMDQFYLKKEWYDSVVFLPFEHMKIAVPCEYEKALEVEYGKEYMTPVQGTADHDYPFYGHMEKELERQIRAVGFEGEIDEFCELVSTGKMRV